MVRPVIEEIDGVDLSQFRPGRLYDLDPSLATYLLVLGVATPPLVTAPALVIPIEPQKHRRTRKRG